MQKVGERPTTDTIWSCSNATDNGTMRKLRGALSLLYGHKCVICSAH
jgi:hypothetical protein